MEQHLDQKADKALKLLNLLRKLSSASVDVEKEYVQMAETLTEVYREEEGYTYRHQYSEISRFLYDEEISTDACAAICDGLYELSRHIVDEGVNRAIEKLIDHIMLESIRMGQMEVVLQTAEELANVMARADTLLDRIKETINDTKKRENELKELSEDARRIDEKQKQVAIEMNRLLQKNEDMQTKLDEKQEEIERIEQEVQKNNIQSISVLSIFAGVVFAFTGGFSILGNVFSNIAQISVDRASFFLACIILVGLILFDVVHLFLYFVDRLARGGTPNKYKPYWIVNIILIVVVIFLMLIYYQIIPLRIQSLV